MPERATINQIIQLGVEVTPGTAVATTKKPQSLTIEPGIQANQRRFRPTGYKWPTLAPPGREWTEFRLGGAPTYTELAYLFSGILAYAAPTQIMDGGTPTGAYTWRHTMSATAEDTIKTYTFEQGSAVRAHRFAYGLFTGLELGFSRDELTLGGGGIAQRITDNHTLTVGNTAIALEPILGQHLDVYMDTTFAGLGTTKLLRAFSGQLSIGDRFGTVWPINSANSSFAAHVEGEPSGQLTLLMAADSVGMGLLTNLRAGSSTYVRLLGTGPTIYTGGVTPTNKLQVDMALKVTDVDPWEDRDGVYAINWTLDFMSDTDLPGGLDVTLVNTLASL